MNRRRGCHLGMYDIQLHSELGMMILLSPDTLLDLYRDKCLTPSPTRSLVIQHRVTRRGLCGYKVARWLHSPALLVILMPHKISVDI